jgi:Bacterial protein of unknown function (DUF916)/Protein of unknown function C-terminal (DUF3324)
MQSLSIKVKAILRTIRPIIYLLPGLLFITNALSVTQLTAHAYATVDSPAFVLQPTKYNSADPATKRHMILHANAASSLQEGVRVTNVGTATGSVSIYPASATTASNTGISYLSKNDAHFGVAAWIQLPNQQVTLAPGQSRDIQFQINIPDSVRSGQHFGGVVAENMTPTSAGSGQLHISITTRVVVSVEVDIPGPLAEQMSVTGVKAGGANGYQSIALSIANVGNVTLPTSTGELKVSSAQGLLLQDLPVKMNTFLPNTTIDYPVNLKKALTAGDYQVSLHLNYGHGKTLDYTTKLTITQDQVNQAFSNGPLQAPTGNSTGNSMPLWQIILVALAALIILLMGGKKVYDLIAARRKRAKGPTTPTDGSNQSIDTSKRRDQVLK